MMRRTTPQRQLVRAALERLNMHATAEQVYEEVVKEFPRISLATVYRNLNGMAGEGEIRRLSMPGGADRFDGAARPHCHLYCRGCGRVEDAPAACDEALFEEVLARSGYALDRHGLILTGLCPRCWRELNPDADRPGDGAADDIQKRRD